MTPKRCGLQNLHVPCPKCGAVIGERCRLPLGGTYTQAHIERIYLGDQSRKSVASSVIRTYRLGSSASRNCKMSQHCECTGLKRVVRVGLVPCSCACHRHVDLDPNL
jgi:hypothetical protein